MLPACQATPQAAAAPPTPVATAVRATQPPVVVAVTATATDLPSFAPLSPEEMATATATATPTVTPAAAKEESVAEATPTPPPTFTPPALPNTSPHEHYWLRRPVAEGGVVWTDKYYPYGGTRGGQLRPHHGVEFNVPYNTEILAAASGTVRVAGSDADIVYGPHTNFYGNLVVVEHDSSFEGQPAFTLYGHLNEVRVAADQHVEVGEVLGLSGATGVADGPHMHFEVRVGVNSYEATYNPLLWLYPFPSRGTVAGRVIWPDGSKVEGAPVTLTRVDGPSPYYATTSYSGNSVNADFGWRENFAIDDVVAGYYEVVVKMGSKKYKAETWVYPYQTSFVEIVLE